MVIDLTFQEKYNCAICPSRCDGKSKTAYIFKDDVQLSEQAEAWLQARLIEFLKLPVIKTQGEVHGLPDLEIRRNDMMVTRVEVKAQGRAFMSVARLLPLADLLPYETVALNRSDLLRYFEIYDKEKKPLYVVWRVRRPCIGEAHWGQPIQVLRNIYHKYGDKRTFRRKSTPSDYVNGEHKGVVVNYHFSLKELIPLEQLKNQIYFDAWDKSP